MEKEPAQVLARPVVARVTRRLPYSSEGAAALPAEWSRSRPCRSGDQREQERGCGRTSARAAARSVRSRRSTRKARTPGPPPSREISSRRALQVGERNHGGRPAVFRRLGLRATRSPGSASTGARPIWPSGSPEQEYVERPEGDDQAARRAPPKRIPATGQRERPQSADVELERALTASEVQNGSSRREVEQREDRRLVVREIRRPAEMCGFNRGYAAARRACTQKG